MDSYEGGWCSVGTLDVIYIHGVPSAWCAFDMVCIQHDNLLILAVGYLLHFSSLLMDLFVTLDVHCHSIDKPFEDFELVSAVSGWLFYLRPLLPL